MRKTLHLPVRRSMNLTEDAYTRLRALNKRYGLGNNYLLVVLLEHLEQMVHRESHQHQVQTEQVVQLVLLEQMEHRVLLEQVDPLEHLVLTEHQV